MKPLIINGGFSKIFSLSLAGHVLVLGIIGVSFTRRSNLERPVIYFGPGLLRKYDLEKPAQVLAKRKLNIAAGRGAGIMAGRFKFMRLRPENPIFQAANERRARQDFFYAGKPPAVYTSDDRKALSRFASGIPPWDASGNNPVFMYPVLPEHLLIYFRDREKVHIELSFRIVSRNGIEQIEVKRKISSGSLEMDLLVLRQVNQYLLLQHNFFPLNIWQTVKIDFSLGYADR